mgnify:CR=1 FL=1
MGIYTWQTDAALGKPAEIGHAKKSMAMNTFYFLEKARRTAGYVTDFWVALPEKKKSNIKSYFLTVP